MKSKIYIAGPMTGIPEHNYPAFNAAAAELQGLGWTVVNPADHGEIADFEWSDYLRLDICKLARCTDIYLLRGWPQSKGATLEYTIASALGMPIHFELGAEGPQVQPGADIGAWGPICNVLSTVAPHWLDEGRTALDAAVNTIQRLGRVGGGETDDSLLNRNFRLVQRVRELEAEVAMKSGAAPMKLTYNAEDYPKEERTQMRSYVNGHNDCVDAVLARLSTPGNCIGELTVRLDASEALETIRAAMPSSAENYLLIDILAELKRARSLFPGDRIMTLAMCEEAGELVKAVLDEPAERVRKEAVQVAAMAMRVVLDGDGSVNEWRAGKGLDALGGDFGETGEVV